MSSDSIYDDIDLTDEQAILLNGMIDAKTYEIEKNDARLFMRKYPNLRKYISQISDNNGNFSHYRASVILKFAAENKLASSGNKIETEDTNTIDDIKALLTKSGYTIKKEEIEIEFQKDNKVILITYSDINY